MKNIIVQLRNMHDAERAMHDLYEMLDGSIQELHAERRRYVISTRNTRIRFLSTNCVKTLDGMRCDAFFGITTPEIEMAMQRTEEVKAFTSLVELADYVRKEEKGENRMGRAAEDIRKSGKKFMEAGEELVKLADKLDDEGMSEEEQEAAMEEAMVRFALKMTMAQKMLS